MKFEKTVEAYQLSGVSPVFFDFAETAPDGDLSAWLVPGYLEEINAQWIHLPAEPFQALCQAACELAMRPDLNRLGYYCRWLLFDSGLHVEYLVHLGFPKPASGVPVLDDFFGLLVHLSGLDIVMQRYQERGIPLSYMRLSYTSVRIWVEAFRRYYGRWGHNRDGARMINIEHLRTIRVGRLEFQPCWYYGCNLVLQSQSDGAVIALSEGGVHVNSNGHVSGSNDRWDPYGWTTRLDERPDCYCGHPIIDGKIVREQQCYPKDEWTEIVRRGQCSLNIHIPRDGRMSKEEIASTMQEAAGFFRTYFPDHPFRIFECHTWLFDPQIPEMLGEDSGIGQFAKCFYRFPDLATDRGAMVFGFTEAPFVMADWQPSTRLQHCIKNHYANGGRMCAAGGFILPDASLPPQTRT